MVSRKIAGKGFAQAIATVSMGVALTAAMVGMPTGAALAKSSSASAASKASVSKTAKKASVKKKSAKKKSSSKKRSSKKKSVTVTTQTAAMNEAAGESLSVFAKPAEGIEMDGPALGAQAAKIARNCVGLRYVYGGANPASGFDCSGLAHYVYKQVGVNVWRTAQDQYNYCKKKSKNVLDKDEIAPGDLVFFGSGKSSISHVGIYLGKNKFVHAVKPGTGVKITKLTKRTNWVAAGRPYKD